MKKFFLYILLNFITNLIKKAKKQILVGVFMHQIYKKNKKVVGVRFRCNDAPTLNTISQKKKFFLSLVIAC